MTEVWKDVVILDGRTERDFFKGIYQVSNLGRIKSIVYKGKPKEKILKAIDNGKGYVATILSNGGVKKRFYLHRLILMAFDEVNYFEGAVADHIKADNRADNNIKNLRWVTQKENMKNPNTVIKLERKLYKKVYCITTNKVFSSIAEGENYYNIGRGSLSSHLNYGTKYAGTHEDEKLIWCFYEDFLSRGKEIIREKEELLKRKNANYKKGSKIVCLTTGKEFNSVREGAEFYKVNKGSISNNLRCVSNSAGILPNGEKLIWCYEKDYHLFNDKNLLDKKIKTANKIQNTRKIVCLTTGQIFESVKEGAEFYNILTNSINDNLKGKNKRAGKLSNGENLVWCTYEEYKLLDKSDIERRIQESKTTKSKGVICLTTSEKFDSIKEGAEFYGIDNSTLGFHLKGRTKSAGKLEDGTKLQWKYLETKVA